MKLVPIMSILSDVKVANPHNLVNGVISNPFGLVTDYSFNDTLTNTSVQLITVVDSNGRAAFNETINLKIFVLPSQSFVGNTNGPDRPRYLVRAAVSISSKKVEGSQMTVYSF